MHREGLVHDGTQICVEGVRRRVDFRELTGKTIAKIEPNRTDDAKVGGDEDEQPLNEMLQAIASDSVSRRLRQRRRTSAGCSARDAKPGQMPAR